MESCTPSFGVIDQIFTLHYSDSMPAISKAAKEGDSQKIRKLIAAGKSPQTPDNRGWTSIHWCVSSGHVEALKLIFKLKSKSKKYLANLKTWEEVTPLMVALKASSPSLEIVKILLKAGACPNSSTLTKLCPLHLACIKKGNIDFVKLLIQNGADVNVQEELGMCTPLHFAVCEAQDTVIIKYLLEKSDLSLKNTYERTAFLEACNMDFIEGVKLFLEKNKSLANGDSEIPPLVYAGLNGNLKMAQLLIEYGANVNCRCNALVPCQTSDSMLVLEGGNYLPVYSSLKNLQVFQLLLNLTDPSEILDVSQSGFMTFPIFVMINGSDVTFYEMLLQSSLHCSLKITTSTMLANFILNCPNEEGLDVKKFLLFFRYNFFLEPDDVFEKLVLKNLAYENEKNVRFLCILAQMGISFGSQINTACLSQKEKPQDSDAGGSGLVFTKLMKTILSLKQLSRLAVRRHIKTLTEDDWLAFKMVQDSGLPECLKKYILFETFK